MSRFVPSFDEGSGSDGLEEIPRSVGLEEFAVGIADMIRLVPNLVARTSHSEPTWLAAPLGAASKWRAEPRACVLLRVALILAEHGQAAAAALARRAVQGLARTEVADAVRRIADLDGLVLGQLRDRGLIASLIAEGLLDPADLLEAGAITARKLPPWQQYRVDQVELDVRLPGFWLAVDAAATLAATLSLLDNEPPDTLGDLGDSLLDVLRVHDAPWSEAMAVAGPHIATRLCQRWLAAKADTGLASAAQHWAYVFLRESGQNSHGDTDVASIYLSAEVNVALDGLATTALDELGRFRSRLRAGGEGADAFRLDSERMFLWARYATWRQAGVRGWWGVVRRLLLLFRELPEPAVPPDLRTWNEATPGFEPLPDGWGRLPDLIGSLCADELSAVIAEDPALESVRKKMGEFFLDRLRPKDGVRQAANLSNDDFVEWDPQWREGYILALQELHVNPGQRGHRLLQHRAEDDPDEHVRATAALAAEQLRRGSWPNTGTPRTFIYGALRRLREAHMLALGFEPDPEGVRRTARLEVRRATASPDNLA